MRTYDTGATRDTAKGKYEYAGFLSPRVLLRFAQYMHKHRIQADGSLRESDNWKSGMPVRDYLDSLLRHVMDVWLLMEGISLVDERGYAVDREDAACAAIFNLQGLLHEWLRHDVGEVQRGESQELDDLAARGPVCSCGDPAVWYAEAGQPRNLRHFPPVKQAGWYCDNMACIHNRVDL